MSLPHAMPLSLQRAPLQPIYKNVENIHGSLEALLNPLPEYSFASPSKSLPRLVGQTPDSTIDEVPSSSPVMMALSRRENTNQNTTLPIIAVSSNLVHSPQLPTMSSSLHNDQHGSGSAQLLASIYSQYNTPIPSLQSKSHEIVRGTPDPFQKTCDTVPLPQESIHESEEKTQESISQHCDAPPLHHKVFQLHGSAIAHLVKNDLRLEALKSSFSGELPYFFQRLITSIKRKYDCETLPFTFGEKTGLKTLVALSAPIPNDWSEFPFRSSDYMVNKYNEFTYTGTRKTKFRNSTERLIYEAQWTVNDSPLSLSRRRRSHHHENIPSGPIIKRKKPASPSKVLQNKITANPVPQKQGQVLGFKSRSLKTEHTKPNDPVHGLNEQISNSKRKRGRISKSDQHQIKKGFYGGYQDKVDPSHKPLLKNRALRDLLAATVYFQTVTGDREPLDLNQKHSRRRNIQAPLKEEKPFQETKPLKETKPPKGAKPLKETRPVKVKKCAPTKAKEIKHSRKSRSVEPTPTPEPVSAPLSASKAEDLQDTYSSFSPQDISHDTMVPLYGRQLFISELYKSQPTFRSVNDIVPNDQFSKSSQPSFGDAHSLLEGLMIKDDLAYAIIRRHNKKYRSLPILFPPLYDLHDDTKINEMNIINVRFLLYPQHFELFLLAEPKSNELDPVQEIIKLMMIHYALFFSHSESIKEIIVRDYCEAIEEAVNLNDFAQFLFIIDKWNLLMLRLSPNAEAVREIERDRTDLNLVARQYLGENERRSISPQELDLDHFYREIIVEELSPEYDIVLQKMSNLCVMEDDRSNVNVSKQPKEYISSFTSRLCEKKDVSRFAIQSILLRVYARVVSTDSKKLRSYKAFTAEVYGELLPSFTSEVLEKTNLRPSQKFYDLGSGVGNTVLQAALEFGSELSGGCELMPHASRLAYLQQILLDKHMALFGLKPLVFNNALLQSFVDNEFVKKAVLDCDVLIINNYLFDVNLNTEVGRLLFGLKPGTKIVSLRNFIRPRYKALGDTIFDRLKVEKHEMSEFMLVSWTANKVPYYISTVMPEILPEYLNKLESPDTSDVSSLESHSYNEKVH